MKKTVYLKIIIIVLFSTFGRAIMFSVAAPNGTTEMVSVASDGTQGNDVSFNSSISADGRYVVFGSYASNLVNGDTNNTDDVFIHDRQTGQTTRVSISSSGIQGNDFSTGASISADGRYVAFQSMASNLVSNDTNNAMDIFVHDRQTSETTRVSVASDGTEANGMSSNYATISSGGRFIGFSSEASNLVSGDTNGVWDVFIHDRQGGQTTRVSASSSGIQGNNVSAGGAFSADARYVTFWSQANNLVSGDTKD